MPLATLNDILPQAAAAGTAVPAIDVVDHASAEAVVEAAEQASRPVILMVPEAALELIDVPRFYPFLQRLSAGATVPVALHLDHGESFATVMTAINHGFSSVMIDGSRLPFDQNVDVTRRVVEVAHAAGLTVEGEIGHVGGDEGSFDGTAVDAGAFTTVEEARRFVDLTGVDALAVAIGTVHGVFAGTPNLDFGRLAEIRAAVDTPLVLHGASGLSDGDLQRAVASGISKVNLFTELSTAGREQALAYARERDDKVHFAELVVAGRNAVRESTTRYLELFGTPR